MKAEALPYILEKLNPQLLNVGFASHHADWNYRNVRSNFTRLYYVTRGTAVVELESGPMQLREGRLYLVPALTTHSNRCDGLFEHYYLHIFDTALQELLLSDNYDIPFETCATEGYGRLVESLCSLFSDSYLTDSNPESYDNIETLERLIKRNADTPAHKRLKAKGIILQLISCFLQEAEQRQKLDPRISKALEIINAGLPDSTLDALIADCCMSKSHFYRLFARQIGISPAECVGRRKADLAKLSLQMSTLPVAEIAYRLGFADVSYFIRFFRKRIGLTPMQFRKQS